MTSMDLPTTQTTPESLEPPIQKSFSCVLCAQRKVKCDKRPGGCANCTKARVTCIYKAPPPPRRRRKGVREVDLTTRMRIYEEALRKLGVDPDLLVKEELSKFHAQKDFVSSSDVKIYTSIETKTLDAEKEEGGVLVMDKGRSRYLENGLWTSLRDEFGDSKDFLDESTDEEEEKAETRAQLTPESSPYDASSLLLGGSRVNASLRRLHPQPAQIYKLWQTYLDNVNPLVKVFHAPTIQQMITNAAGNLDEISKSVEVLLFCIYCISLESLSNLECDAVMGEPKVVVSQRFRAAAQHALINASFLKTSDIMVLQALTIFILSLQNDDAQIIWTLAGIAQRIAQRLGLHRDPEGLGLPPFEVQIRRRLWWQIIMLEGFSQKLAGTGGALYVDNVKLPLNINDGELYMGMKETPKEHQGATEMMHFLIRCHVGDFLRRTALNGAFRNFDGAWNGLTSKNVSFAVKEKAIRELEGTLRTKFLQNIDQSIPWHVLCSFLVQAIINMMMFTAYNPYVIRGIPPSEKDFLFEMSHQVITGQNLAYTRSEMQNYLWHINLHFQWKAFIYLVSELRFRHHGPKVDDAWKQVELVYDFHPNFAKDLSRRALPIAIGRLTLKAWDAYSAARGISPDPYFIQILRTRQNRSKSVDTMSQTTSNATPETGPTKHMESSSAEFKAAAPSNDLQPLSWNTDIAASLDTDPTTDIPYFPPIDPEQMNWSNWDNLLDEFQLQDGDGNLLPTEHVTNFGFGGL